MMPIPGTGFVINRVTRFICREIIGLSEQESKRIGLETGLKVSIALFDPVSFKLSLTEAKDLVHTLIDAADVGNVADAALHGVSSHVSLEKPETFQYFENLRTHGNT